MVGQGAYAKELGFCKQLTAGRRAAGHDTVAVAHEVQDPLEVRGISVNKVHAVVLHAPCVKNSGMLIYLQT